MGGPCSTNRSLAAIGTSLRPSPSPSDFGSIVVVSRYLVGRHVFCLDGEVPSTPCRRATWGGCVASCAATRGHSFGLRAFCTDKPCPCIVLCSFAGRHAEFASYPNRNRAPDCALA